MPSRPPDRRPGAVWLTLAAALLTAGLLAACGGAHLQTTTSATTSLTPAPTTTTSHGHGEPPASWLGLDFNSTPADGDLARFSRIGIRYSRDGPFEVGAGDTPANDTELAHGLATANTAGMIPDIVVEPVAGSKGCSTNPDETDLCLPVTGGDLQSYVRGFVQTVTAVRKADHQAGLIFEPANEPWDWAYPPGSQSSADGAGEYASLLALLLPAVKQAGIPLSEIFVPATGTLSDGTNWVSDLYQKRPCLKPGPDSCGPIEGWNLHPYGPPYSDTIGLASVPVTRRQMASGADNIVVSEIGFCSTDVPDDECDANTPTVDGSSAQTAQMMSEMLSEALAMHRAGWLKAVEIWVRNGGGWAMETASGALTSQGSVLVRFAQRYAGG